MEIVMPDSEIVKMGSLANGDDPSGGEGIGPDLRGIMRGYIQGCWDVWESVRRWRSRHCRFQPDIPKPAGISPDARCS